MKQKNTWVLLLALAVIITVIILLVREPDKNTGREELSQPPPFAGLQLDQLAQVVVKTARADATLRRDGDHWVVEEFDDFPADLPALEAAILALQNLELGDVVSENREKRATFQVDQSGIEVQLRGPGGEGDLKAHFFLGKPGTDYRHIYFRLADSDNVHLVDQQLRGRFDRGARTWRNRRPFSFAPEEVTALRLAAGDNGEPLSLRKNDEGGWVIEGDEPLPADTAKVELVARSFAQLAADDFPEERAADLAVYGLDQPKWTYRADLLDGSTHTLLVGSVDQDENRLFAKRDDSPIVYILGKFRIRNLSKTVDEIRLEPADAPPPEGEE